jgi:hypothetical protein
LADSGDGLHNVASNTAHWQTYMACALFIFQNFYPFLGAFEKS